jgi:hypothetical protein
VGEIRPAGSDEAIEIVRGYVSEETARRLERDRARAVRGGLAEVKGRGQRRRTAILIASSYGHSEIVQELSGR